MVTRLQDATSGRPGEKVVMTAREVAHEGVLAEGDQEHEDAQAAAGSMMTPSEGR